MLTTKFVHLFLCLVSIFHCVRLEAQITLTGVVKTSDQKPISNATIIAQSNGSSKTLAYGFSNSEGKFVLSIAASTADSINLTVSHISFREQKRLVAIKQSIPLLLTLEARDNPLPEVTVRNKNIYLRGDTVNYNVAGFQQRQDLVIGDVIARMPGMEVKPNGQILYQGRPINKYYIEGADLLEDRYNLANRNLPADAVAQVQVLENHQPIRALDSLRPSNQAALNIKLKNGYKGRLTGRARLGAGGPPLGADAELVPMRFAAGSQTLATAKHNSLGHDYTQELTQYDAGSGENHLKGGLISFPVTAVPAPNPPPIAASRYLFNQLYQLSLNHLVKGKKGLEWKGNVDAYVDKQTQNAGNNNVYFFPNDTIAIAEQNALTQRRQMLRAALTAQKNEPQYFFKNTSTIQLNGWQPDALTTGSFPLSQQQRFASVAIANNLQYIRTGGKKTRLFSSFVSYAAQNEELQLLPGPKPRLLLPDTAFERLVQPIQKQQFFTHQQVGLGVAKRGKWRFETGLGISFLQSSFRNQINVYTAAPKTALSNRFEHSELALYGKASAVWRPGRFTLLAYADPQLVQAWGRSTDTSFRNLRLLPNPSIDLQYRPNGTWFWQVNASSTQRFSGAEQALPGWLLHNYREFVNGNAFFKWMAVQRAKATLQYKDVVRSLFVTTGLGWDNLGFNYLANQQFDGVIQTRSLLPIYNPQSTASAFLRYSQQWGAWGINGSGSVGQSGSRQMQNGLLIRTQNRQLMLSAGAQGQAAWFSGNYQLSYQRTSLQQRGQPALGGLETFTQSAAAHMNAGKGWMISTKAEHYAFGSRQLPGSEYAFADLLVRKQWTGKQKIQAELSWLNVGNRGRFRTAQLSTNQQIESIFILRPAQWMASVHFLL